jgi:CBS domain-containing protein
MQIKNIMTQGATLVNPETSIHEAADRMLEQKIGFLLVGENDRLKGTVTDRDIVLKVVAKGLDPDSSKVRDIINSGDILYCREDQEVEDVADNMSEKQVRRMPVVDDSKRLVGVVSIGDLAQHVQADRVGKLLQSVTSG